MRIINIKLHLQALLTLSFLVLSLPALALGVGALRVESGLNEHFEARLPVLSATPDELDSLRVSLADQDAFSRVGIDRSAELSKLRFQLVETAADDYIHITSTEPIREPFLNFLVELRWNKGRLLREFTVLLDPPLYDPAAGRMRVDTPPVPRAPTPGTAAAPGVDPGDTVPRPDTMAPRAPYVGGDYGPVREGETLWVIANTMRPGDVSIHQMMLALLRANPDAFLDGNVNALRSGAILNMPDTGELQQVNRTEALAEFERQVSRWRTGAPAPPAVPAERPETVTPAAPPPAEQVSVAENATAATDEEVAEESELRLLAATDAGEMRPGNEDAATAGDLQTELSMTTEDLESARLENVELKDRLIEAEELIEDLKRLIALKDDELASLQQRMQETEAEFPQPEPEPEPEAPVVAPEPAPPAAAEPEPLPDESLLATLMDGGRILLAAATHHLANARDFAMANLTMVGGGLAALLAFIAAALFVSRRRESAMAGEAVDTEAELVSPDYDAVVADDETFAADINISDEEAAGDFPIASDWESDADHVDETGMFSIPAQVAVEADAEPEEDPLAEVNILIAYEHFDQAEEFVRNAIAEQPGNAEYHAKLLEVFYASNDKLKYEDAARALQELTGGEGEQWDMALAMWQEISPNRALFAAGAAEEPEAGVPEDAAAGSRIVDITGDTAGAGAADEGGLDFDLGDTTAGGTAAAADEAGDMLDITASNEQQGDEDMLDLTAAVNTEDDGALDMTPAGEADHDALDFDIGSGTDAATDEADEGLDFALDMEPAADQEQLPDQQDAAEAEDLLDVTSDRNVQLDSGEDLLDVTSSMKSTAETATDDALDAVDADAGTVNEEGLPDLDMGLDFPADTSDAESELEFEGSPESADAVDLDIGLESESLDEAGVVDDAIDLDSGETDNEVSDLSIDFDPEADDAGLSLDMDTGDDEAEELGEGFSLDMDTGDDEAGELGADLMLDMDGELDEAMETADSEDHTEFSLELDAADQAALDSLELDTAEDIEADDSMDLDATVQFPSDLAIKPGLSLVGEKAADDDEDEKTMFVARSGAADEEQSTEDEMTTKLDLAKAYVELGDADSARSILDEVLREGNDAQKSQARELLQQL